MRDLDDFEMRVLDTLSDTGAAVPTDLAVRMREMPEKVIPALRSLLGRELVEVLRVKSGYDSEVYRISDKGRRMLKLARMS
jgi:hypothetical protein